MTSPVTAQRAHAEQEAKRHSLLADPTRLEVVLALSKGPETVSGLASRLGVHVNTVRAHLERLQAEGMVTQELSAPEGRGRPARRFFINPDAARDSQFPGRDYRLLSEVLLSVVRSQAGRNIEQAALESGREWGHHLSSGKVPRPGKARDPETAVSVVKDIFEQMQFAPEVQKTRRGWDILLHNCPYREIARDNQDAICSFHQGILKGVLGTVGSEMEPESLQPFIKPDLCCASLVAAPVRRKPGRSRAVRERQSSRARKTASRHRAGG